MPAYPDGCMSFISQVYWNIDIHTHTFLKHFYAIFKNTVCGIKLHRQSQNDWLYDPSKKVCIIPPLEIT